MPRRSRSIVSPIPSSKVSLPTILVSVSSPPTLSLTIFPLAILPLTASSGRREDVELSASIRPVPSIRPSSSMVYRPPYEVYGRCLDALERGGSVKSVTVGSDEVGVRARKEAYKVVGGVVGTPLDAIISKTSLFNHHLFKNKSNLLRVLVYELLFSPRGLQGTSRAIEEVKKNKTRLRAEWARAEAARAKGAEEIGPASPPHPRWVRVNTLLTSLEELTTHLQKIKVDGKAMQLEDDSRPECYHVDPHIPNLLAFHPSFDFQRLGLYRSGALILQDKASCMPAHILLGDLGDTSPPYVLDACAAPGNKTSHLSALLADKGDKGRVIAYERDKTRYKVLVQRIKEAGCKNVDIVNADFLSTDPGSPTMSKVTHLLLDPSCSGSGIVNREEVKREEDPSRLEKLASFQKKILLHAMQFPSAHSISYSTCSLSSLENEQVVAHALSANPSWTLTPRTQVLPTWPRRGDGGGDMAVLMSDQLDSLVRCHPDDGMNGFFVALFRRRPSRA